MLLKEIKDTNFIELLKGSSISFLLRVVGMLFGYLAMFFTTNIYGSDAWGIHALCFTILGLLTLIPKFGFENSLIRIVTELNLSAKSEIVSVFKKAIVISVSLALIVTLTTYFSSHYVISNFSEKHQILPFIKTICIVIIPSTILAVISAYFQALKKIAKHILFHTTAINIIFFVLLLCFYFFNIELAVFETYVMAIFITFLIALYYFFYSLKSKNKSDIENEERTLLTRYNYKSITKTSFPMLLSISFALLMGWSDVIILSIYNTASDLGIYDTTLKLSALSGIFLISVNSIAAPKFVEFYSKSNINGLKETVQKSTKLIFITTTPVLVILVLFSKTILGFFGDEFVLGYFALTVLCVSRFINAISGSVGYIMQMTDHQTLYQNVIITAFFLNVILNFILIPQYGINGAAIASSIAMTFWNITLVVIIKRKLGFWTMMSF